MKRALAILFLLLFGISAAFADDDLTALKKRGILRHLGVPYANFVSGDNSGLSVETMRLFAEYLGVDYQYVKTSWKDVIPDLIGKKVFPDGEKVTLGEDSPIRGDVIDNGLTILPWREKVVSYSSPTFPTQVWLITRIDTDLRPIKPSGNIDKDIAATKSLLAGRQVLGKEKTCLDPSLYHLREIGAAPRLFDGNLNELAPAIINGQSETSILDVPDALVALEKWPGQILILGPISPRQEMGAAFRPDSTGLHRGFNTFLEKIRRDGTYVKLVKKYYPAVFDYYPDFFTR